MKKCNQCESLLPTTYEECPKCKTNNFSEHKKNPIKHAKLRVQKPTHDHVMACHSIVKPS